MTSEYSATETWLSAAQSSTDMMMAASYKIQYITHA